MNKYISTFLTYLKYFGIVVGLGYLTAFVGLMIHFYMDPMAKKVKEGTVVERLKEALAETLYIILGSTAMFVMDYL